MVDAIALRWFYVALSVPFVFSSNGDETANEVAELLRTSRPAVYAMVERGQIPGVVRIGRRVLVCKSPAVDSAARADWGRGDSPVCGN